MHPVFYIWIGVIIGFFLNELMTPYFGSIEIKPGDDKDKYMLYIDNLDKLEHKRQVRLLVKIKSQ